MQHRGSLFGLSPTARTHTRLFILGVLCCMGVPMGRQPGVIKITSTEAFKCSKTKEVSPVPGTLVCFLTPFQKWSHASPKGLGLLFHCPRASCQSPGPSDLVFKESMFCPQSLRGDPCGLWWLEVWWRQGPLQFPAGKARRQLLWNALCGALSREFIMRAQQSAGIAMVRRVVKLPFYR